MNEQFPKMEQARVLTSLLSPRPVPRGTSTVIAAAFQDGGQPVRGADVRAVVLRFGRRSDFRLRGDGVFPDSAAGDGIYSARSEVLTQVGDHYVDLAALREDSAGSFTVLAQAKDVISVSRSRSRLDGRIQDFGRDTNGDGFHDELVLRVGFHATDACRYAASGVLSDGKGHTQSARGEKRVLFPGNDWIELAFDGRRIFDAGEDGPYSLTQMLLIEEDVATSYILEERSGHYRTRPYRFREFQRDPIRIARTVDARLVDRDADGQPDALDVALHVEIDVAGEYWWEGTLRDTLGRGSVAANGHGDLEPGEHRLVLRYLGSRLRPLGSPGVFRLEEIAVTGNAPAAMTSGIPVPGIYPSADFDVRRGP